jgi:hypothetical protein
MLNKRSSHGCGPRDTFAHLEPSYPGRKFPIKGLLTLEMRVTCTCVHVTRAYRYLNGEPHSSCPRRWSTLRSSPRQGDIDVNFQYFNQTRVDSANIDAPSLLRCPAVLVVYTDGPMDWIGRTAATFSRKKFQPTCLQEAAVGWPSLSPLVQGHDQQSARERPSPLSRSVRGFGNQNPGRLQQVVVTAGVSSGVTATSSIRA